MFIELFSLRYLYLIGHQGNSKMRCRIVSCRCQSFHHACMIRQFGSSIVIMSGPASRIFSIQRYDEKHTRSFMISCDVTAYMNKPQAKHIPSLVPTYPAKASVTGMCSRISTQKRNSPFYAAHIQVIVYVYYPPDFTTTHNCM